MTSPSSNATFTRVKLPALTAALLALGLSLFAEENNAALKTLIPWLLDDQAAFKGVRFAEVIATATGHQVQPVLRDDAEEKRILAAIGTALDKVLVEMNAPGSKTRAAKRVNEMSSHFENAIQRELTAIAGFTCAFPKTAAGQTQRSGYPDLVLTDSATKRVFYLDPKLYAAGSRTSSFRTFYYEPKGATNKVTQDARHLIIGIEHQRQPDGSLRFAKWELIDLSEFRVRLKAEFEGSNADMYRREAVVGAGEAKAAE